MHLSKIYSAPWSIPPWWWAHCWVCRRPWKSGPLECRRSSWRRCGGTLWTCSCSFCRSPQCAPGTAQTGTKPQTNQIKRQIRIDNIFSSNLDLWQSEVSSLGKSRTHLLLLLLCQQTHLRTFLWRCCCVCLFKGQCYLCAHFLSWRNPESLQKSKQTLARLLYFYFVTLLFLIKALKDMIRENSRDWSSVYLWGS